VQEVQDEDEMAERAHQALAATVAATEEAKKHAEEAALLFGSIRREIAVAKARKERP
jgi:hypothetical protein